jgi:hypothetical protein
VLNPKGYIVEYEKHGRVALVVIIAREGICRITLPTYLEIFQGTSYNLSSLPNDWFCGSFTQQSFRDAS